ncbi:hypothetical protein [Sediminibacterium goheungense]|uniref:Uncharacterized protein n=1 Tax=Sediminibacterium goheungense TaxID=1086393 RepID=A0A4R6IT58_9BACT|nr:hypothetical protein [Sediminibacterium goheungense]TDO25176.1 hypothetical protein BC659_3192 [Sediminibacterium goheungense]
MAVFYKNEETYQSGTGNLFLFLKVGMGQYYNAFVKIGKKKLVFGQFEVILIGTVEDCHGKKLFVEINATDVNPHTDNVPVNIILKDDQQETVYDYSVDADKNGGTILFEIEFTIK